MNSMRLDAGLAALVDLEDEIDAVVRQLDDLGLDADVEAAAAAVDLDDALHVGLHHRARQRAARLRLDFGLELLVLDLLVALEGDPVDDRVLDDRDDRGGRPAMLGRTSWNRPVANSALTPSSICEGVEPAAGPRPEIGADRVGLDALVALDDDRVDRDAWAWRRRAVSDTARQRQQQFPRGPRQTMPSPRTSHTEFHPRRALFVPFGHPRTTRKVVASPQSPRFYRAFVLSCNHLLLPLRLFVPERASPTTPSSCAARCRMSL